jgi:dihydroorotase
VQNFLITNGRVIDPGAGTDTVRSIAIAAGRIVDPAQLENDPATTQIDAAGLVVCPGLVDIHVHFREPGGEYKETIATGTSAAAVGGFTTVVMMPNTIPPIDSVEIIQKIQARVDDTACVHAKITACLTLQRCGDAIADLRAMARDTAVVAFTDDGNCVQDEALMLQAATIAAELDIPITDHCEDEKIIAGGVMRQGPEADAMQVQGMPGETESNIVARNIELSRRTGAHFHMQHLSSAVSIEHMRRAKADGIRVTAEVTPHHLALTVADVPTLGSSAKMNPPLGTAADRQALLEALADGTIDAIATDHAPHAPWEKAGNFAAAPFGVLGLETALSVSLTTLYHTGIVDLPELVRLMTLAPARLLRLDAGTLAVGAVADVTLFDPDAELVVDITTSGSRSRNSPFHGRTVRGAVAATMCSGAWVYKAPTFDNPSA